MISIVTTTFNRAHTLPRLYESLKEQDFKDFEWIIVDDGSIDDTESLIQRYKTEGTINIKYIKIQNSGKAYAYNKGLEEANCKTGDIFVCIDSDDVFEKNVFGKFVNDFAILPEECCGVCYLCADIIDKNIIGTGFPENVERDFYYNFYTKLGVKGDKFMALRAEVAKEYPFPIIDGEKFVPEALLFNRMAKKYMFKLSNDVVLLKEYLEGGYTDKYFDLVKRNPKTNMLYYKELYDYEPSLYNVAAYDMFGMFSKTGFLKTVNGHPSKLKAFAMYFPAYIKYLKKRK